MVQIAGAGQTALSARYAAALYALAFEQNILNETVEQMAELGRLIRENDQLRHFIASPVRDAFHAAPILRDILTSQNFLPIIVNFANVVVANRRLSDLPSLISGFAAYVAAKRGEIVAEVASAHPLTELQRNQLRARLTESGFGRVNITEQVDPSLLGGLVLKIGAKLYDTSLKSRLNRLNYSLKGAA